MVFLVFKKRKLHIVCFGEDSSLNKEVPDIERATVSVPDPRSRSAVCLAKRSGLCFCLTQLDRLQLGKRVSPRMSYKNSCGFSLLAGSLQSMPVPVYLTLHVSICLIPKF